MQQKIILKLIWGQKVIEVNEINTFPKRVVYKKIGPIFGPFRVPSEAAQVLSIRKSNQSKVNEILKGNKKSIEGYTFWYEGECEHVFKIPNVREFKRQIQLKNIKKHTKQTLKQNLQLMGFEILSIGTVKGTETKVTAKCCREKCDGICERSYKEFVSDESVPVCKKCLPIIKSFAQKQKCEALFLHEIRAELASYYDSAKNNHIPFTAWRKGSKKKIFLTCPDCQHVQSESEATTPNKYTTKKRNDRYYTSFTCAVCNSLKVKFPEIALQWDSSKNGQLPDLLAFAANQMAWWKCEKGHTWKAYIDDRTCQKSNCPQCALVIKDSKAGMLMKKVMKQLFSQASVEDEVLVPNTLYRNDCVVKLKGGQRIAFEMQGDYWHYDEKKLIKTERELEHKDARKIAANRAHGDLVFLLNEYDFNMGRNTLTEDLMEFAIQDIMEHIKKENYAVGCDVAYNREKCYFALNNEKAYYLNRYKQIHQIDYNEQLHPKAKVFAQFQDNWGVFEQKTGYLI